jgi:hypothetical protein
VEKSDYELLGWQKSSSRHNTITFVWFTWFCCLLYILFAIKHRLLSSIIRVA